MTPHIDKRNGDNKESAATRVAAVREAVVSVNHPQGAHGNYEVQTKMETSLKQLA